MTDPLVALVPPEPEGDRPAVADSAGDVWQRRGPLGTRTWYAALPQTSTTYPDDRDADPTPFARGRAWVELVAVFGHCYLLEVPVGDPPPYTGELPASST